MNKIEFLNILREKLKDLPHGEVERIIQYYEEYLADAGESGKVEEETISELGDTDVLVNKLKAEQSFETAKQKPTLSNGAKALIAAVVLIFSFPVAFPIVMAVFGIIVALFATIVGLGIALIALLVTSIAIIITLLFQSFSLFPGNTGMTLLMLGGTLFSSGILTLLLIGFVTLTRLIVTGLINLIKTIINWATNKRRKG